MNKYEFLVNGRVIAEWNGELSLNHIPKAALGYCFFPYQDYPEAQEKRSVKWFSNGECELRLSNAN